MCTGEVMAIKLKVDEEGGTVSRIDLLISVVLGLRIHRKTMNIKIEGLVAGKLPPYQAEIAPRAEIWGVKHVSSLRQATGMDVSTGG